MPARPIRSARDAPVAVVRMHMHTYVFVRIFVRRRRREGFCGTEGKSSSCIVSVDAQGVHLRVHEGVRALVPMLSADIPRDRPRARVRDYDIIIAEPSIFPHRAFLGMHGKWYLERSDRVA